MTTLQELISLCERAEGPSRELDGIICRATGWHRVEPRFTSNKKGGWIAPSDFIGVHSDGGPILDSLHGTTIHRDPAPVTSSINDAIALAKRVLPGWRIQVEINDQEPSTAVVWSNDHRQRESVIGPSGKSSQPAIALVLAVLRALEAKGKA